MKVEFHPEVLKQLQRPPRDAFETALKKIIDLTTEPRPHGAKKLAGSDHDWRIRFGQYRIVYEINNDQQTLTVFTVAKRSDVYR
ncbi:MAG TPA: type II toxin-antitoxin system RelE/ParE family toxin [Jiangellaceae bacterium]